MKLEQEAVTRLAEKKSTITTVPKKRNKARGIWGLKFGMNSKEIANIKNDTLSCYLKEPLVTWGDVTGRDLQCRHKNFKRGRMYQGWGLRFSSYHNENRECPYYGLNEIQIGIKKYTIAGWNKTLKSLKRKYKVLVSPTAEQRENFAYGLGDGEIKYIFENKKQPNRPKYLIYQTSNNGIKVHYLSEKVAKTLLRGVTSKQKAEDDL